MTDQYRLLTSNSQDTETDLAQQQSESESSTRQPRYYTPMTFDEIENGVRKRKYWAFEDGSIILWGTY